MCSSKLKLSSFTKNGVMAIKGKEDTFVERRGGMVCVAVLANLKKKK